MVKKRLEPTPMRDNGSAPSLIKNNVSLEESHPKQHPSPESAASHSQDNPWPRHITQICYILPIIKGVSYPILKVCLIALAEKLFRDVIRESIDGDFFLKINEEIFDKSTNPIMDVFLLQNLTFYEVFALTSGLVFLVAIALPLNKALQEHYLNNMEVKRLQNILYERFILEPDSVAIDEASDLLYTKINKVEMYWSRTKYKKVDDLSTICSGLFLLLILAWDLGLACLGMAGVVFGVSSFIWKTLSTPWHEQQEQKMVQTNAHLIDIVVCKEVVLTQAQELKEQTRLQELMRADENDLRRLVWAKFISESVQSFTFIMITPVLFLFVYLVDLTMERVFQLLILIVVLDELMRAFLAYSSHAEVEAEYTRAKACFCHVLGLEEEILFPPDFIWPKGRNDDLKNDSSEAYTVDEEDGNTVIEKSYSELVKSRGNHRREIRQTMMGLSDIISKTFAEAQGQDDLTLNDVSFGYKANNGDIITVAKQLNMNLKIGEHYAILGESGVGKSTLLKAMSGLHEPLEGDIRFCGNVVDTTSILWREKVAVVSQDSVFLNRTLRENLVYGLTSKKTDQDIYDALEKVKMRDRVMAQPGGLDMIIEGNGSCFSGGQRQRLQIARLLLTNAPLVLLDECTSALDPATTEEVLDVLKEFLVGKTLIMITHDIKTLVLAQQVLEMTCDGMVEQTLNTRQKPDCPMER